MKKIYIILATIIVLYLLYKSKNVARTKINQYKMVIPESEIKQAFANLQNLFSKETLQVTEKILRLETAHFSSGGYKKTLGAGMEVFKPSFPYGWSSLAKFWTENPQFAPIGIVEMNENKQPDIAGSGVKKVFLRFPSVMAGIATTAKIMQLRNNIAGSWYSKNPESIAKYNLKINQIKSRYV